MHSIRQELPTWPTHAEKPYAFKAYALDLAADAGYDTIVWADACMYPVQSMEPLFQRIERDGYWFSRNGWNNYEWTADSAYPDLFPELFEGKYPRYPGSALDTARAWNRDIPHVVATCFGLNMRHKLGHKFLREYLRLANTSAFCGPWINKNHVGVPGESPKFKTDRCYECGPSDVRGHRHDQTVASVIAHNLGLVLTDPPDVFCYGKKGEQFDSRTIMIADGSY
jgi:hypothetical protein